MKVDVRSLKDGTVPFVVIAAALLFANLRLLAVNHRLLGRAEAAEESMRSVLSARVGSEATPIRGYDFARHPIAVDFVNQNRPTVILAFSPKCPACDEMWPVWSDLVSQVSPAKWRILAVDVSQLSDEAYLRPRLPPYAIAIASPDAQSMIDFPLRLTPQMIVVDKVGIVRSVWTGATQNLGEHALSDMARTLGVVPRHEAPRR